jgi:hypothetical protein
MTKDDMTLTFRKPVSQSIILRSALLPSSVATKMSSRVSYKINFRDIMYMHAHALDIRSQSQDKEAELMLISYNFA